MHSFADTMEQPVVEKIGGKDYTFPLLTQRDYLTWIDKLTQERKQKALKSAPPATKPLERAQWMDYVENLEVTPHELRTYVFRAKGMTEVLEIAFKKAGIPDDEIGKLIDSRTAKQNEMLAVRVSGLFRREELEQMYPKASKPRDEKVGDNPNDETPAPQSAGESTGPSADSSSSPVAA
jgi:hypothetical protein